MKIAVIDSCYTNLGVYSMIIFQATGIRVDCFEDPLEFLATRVRKYDLVISEYFFEGANLNFYWRFFEHQKLIILTGITMEQELNCLAVFNKSSPHSKNNIISLIKISRPSLGLVQTD